MKTGELLILALFGYYLWTRRRAIVEIGEPVLLDDPPRISPAAPLAGTLGAITGRGDQPSGLQRTIV